MVRERSRLDVALGGTAGSAEMPGEATSIGSLSKKEPKVLLRWASPLPSLGVAARDEEADELF